MRRLPKIEIPKRVTCEMITNLIMELKWYAGKNLESQKELRGKWNNGKRFTSRGRGRWSQEKFRELYYDLSRAKKLAA